MSVVVAALSGGVDSTVSAFLLGNSGRTVVGASHEICTSRVCNDETMGRARSLCETLGIPYYRLPMREDFGRAVIDDFVDSYRNGLTPNPCVRCNERIRFSLFYERMKVLLERDGFLQPGDPLHIATGHYARIEYRNGRPFIRRGADRTKDQSYMLYRLPAKLLPYVVLPLGGMTKKDVVSIAVRNGFPSASVRESQDICFIQGEYTDFLRDGDGAGELFRKGEIRDVDGNFLGYHGGYVGYTAGQRKGLGLGNGPWYVVRTEPSANLVVVGRKGEHLSETAVLGQMNWFVDPPAGGLDCTVNLRYQSKDIPCTVYARDDGSALVKLSSASLVSPGQSGVLYLDDLVLGGGIIASRSVR